MPLALAAAAARAAAPIPATAGFQRLERVVRGSTLAPLAFPDVRLAAADILG